MVCDTCEEIVIKVSRLTLRGDQMSTDGGTGSRPKYNPADYIDLQEKNTWV